jgi:alkylated DNA repair dioxygenase AlkB
VNDDMLDVLFVENFLREADGIFRSILEEVVWDERMHARKTASFGTPYDYSQITYAPAPMHLLLVPVVEGLEARFGHRYNNCLVNLYENGGNTMGFHVDDMRGLVADTGVAIVSVGATRSIVFQRIGNKTRTETLRLTPGSLLWMPSALQELWKHGIPAEPGASARISLTFRAIHRELSAKLPSRIAATLACACRLYRCLEDVHPTHGYLPGCVVCICFHRGMKKKLKKTDLIEKTRSSVLARNKARLGELTAEIRRWMSGVVESFYYMGEALREIADKKLYAAAKHASMEAFLEAERLMSVRRTRKLIAVTRKVPRPTALTLGQERTYALVSYTQVTETHDSAKNLVMENARIHGKPIEQASLREIEAATRAARTDQRKRRPRSEAERDRAMQKQPAKSV